MPLPLDPDLLVEELKTVHLHCYVKLNALKNQPHWTLGFIGGKWEGIIMLH